jgi:hypothetical protein
LIVLLVFASAGLGAMILAALQGASEAQAQQAAPASQAGAAEPEPAPPEGQTYTGVRRCASCHFDQFTDWKATSHSRAFELLTAKYQNNADCVKCHVTGFGEPTGFKSMATTPSLAGVTCETCHGPGSKHEEIAKPFANVAKLTPAQEKQVRDSIWKMKPSNICVECHTTQAHKGTMTPPELRKKS